MLSWHELEIRLSGRKVCEGMEVSDIAVFVPYILVHVPQQEVVVLHHSPDVLVGDGGAAVPDAVPALETEDLPEPASLHLLWAPPVEIIPGDTLQDLKILGIQISLIVISRRVDNLELSRKLQLSP